MCRSLPGRRRVPRASALAKGASKSNADLHFGCDRASANDRLPAKMKLVHFRRVRKFSQTMTDTSFSARKHRTGFDPSGIIQFMTLDLFSNPPAEQQLGIEKVDLWHHIDNVSRRGDLYHVETATPTLRLKLRFSPSQAANGDYEIHPTRGGVERGRTETVRSTIIHTADQRFVKLARFPVRFQVVTIASESPHGKKMWIIGFNEPPEAPSPMESASEGEGESETE